MKQQSLWDQPAKKEHGGKKAKGKRKAARVIVTKSPMLVTFKSSRATGKWNMLRLGEEIKELVHEAARRWRVRVRLYQNVGNHLHLAVQAASRREMQNFLREVGGKIATLVTKAKKGNAIGRFWDDLVHSRVVHWGRDWFGVQQYFEKNRFEAAGVPREIADRVYEPVRAALPGREQKFRYF